MKDDNKNKKIISIFIVIVVMIYFSWLSSYTMPVVRAIDSLSEYQARQEELQQQMEEQEKIIQQYKNEENAYRSEIASLDNKINRLKLDAEAANIQQQVTANVLVEIKAQLAEAENRLEERTVLLQERVADIYTNGDVSYIDVLLEAGSYSDFLMRFDMLEMIVAQDITLLEQVNSDRALIEEKKSLQEQCLEDLEVLKQSKLNAIESLEVLQREKNEFLNKADQNEVAAEKVYNEMEQASIEIASQIRKIQETNYNIGEFSGQFAWPLPGYTSITDDYGMRRHPVLDVNKMHTGIDIRAPQNTSILAVEAGTVILAQYNSAYGNMVIIDHGGGVSTLYGHMNSIGVSVSQFVERKEIIGKVGTTGLSTGNHLHFEVRINGEHVNPWTYLK